MALYLATEDAEAWMVLAQTNVVLGKDAACDFVLLDPEVSGFHCSLHETGPDSVQVQDLGSRSGTLLNGVRISSPLAAGPGDVLTVGRTRLEIRRIPQGASRAAKSGT